MSDSNWIGRMFDALAPYGLQGAILGLVVLIVLALIKTPKSPARNVIRIVQGVIITFTGLAFILVVHKEFFADTKPAVGTKQPGVEPTPQPPPVQPKQPAPLVPSILKVSGQVTPRPQQPAYVSIEGVTGRWPIDKFGTFSFSTPGPQREVVVSVEYGDNQKRSGYYFLSGELLRISIK